MARQDYVSEQIDRQESARQRYDTTSSKENKRKLEEEVERTKRALDNLRSGAGRGMSQGADTRKSKRQTKR